MSKLINSLAVAASAVKVVDINWNMVRKDNSIFIDSTSSGTLVLFDGCGGDDPTQTHGTAPSQMMGLPYVLNGSSVPVYDETGSSYSIVANTTKKIVIKRNEISNWIRFQFTDGGAGGTVNVYGDII